MATDNPNYYQEEQIDDRGIIPTRRWATEGANPSVGLHIDNYDNLFNRNINVGKDVSQPDEELLKRVSVANAINQGMTPEEAMGEVETAKERLSRALVNNLAIAGTTAVQGTVGFLYGIFDAMANTELSRLWDNDVNRTMFEIQQSVQENNRNYYTKDYNDMSIWKQMGTSMFWADLVQNLGYSEGMLIPGMGMSKLLSSAPKILQVALPSIVGSLGEASMEAIQNKNDKLTYENRVLTDEYNKRFAQATSNEERQRLYDSYKQQLLDSEEDANQAGNFVFGSNTALLTLSNMLEWGKVFSRGAAKTANTLGKEVRRGADGLLSQSSKAWQKTKNVGEFLKNATSEGIEEVSQDIIQKTADLNIDYNSFNDSIYNPEARELVDGMWKSLYMATSEALKDKQTATDFMMGFMTSVVGTPTIRGFHNNQGKLQVPLIEGGVLDFAGEMRQTNQNYERRQAIIDEINKGLKEGAIKNRYEGLVRSINLTNKMNQAAINNNDFLYHTFKDAGVISDVIMFDNLGQLDYLKEIATQAKNVSDEDLQSIVDEIKNQEGNGAFSSNNNNENLQFVREKVNENAKNILDTIDKYTETKQKIENRAGFRLDKPALETAINASLQIENFTNRRQSIIDSLYETYINNSTTSNTNTVSKQEFTDKLLKGDKEFSSKVKDVLKQSSNTLTVEDNIKKLEDVQKLTDIIKDYDKNLDAALKTPEKANKKANESKAKAIDDSIKKAREKVKDRLKNANSISEYRKALNEMVADSSISDNDITKANEEMINEGSAIAKENRTIDNIAKSAKINITNNSELSDKEKADAINMLKTALQNAENSDDILDTAFSQYNSAYTSILTTNPNYKKESDTNGEQYKNFLKLQYHTLNAVKQALNDNQKFEAAQRITVTDKNNQGQQSSTPTETFPQYDRYDSAINNDEISSDENNKEQIDNSEEEEQRLEDSWKPLSWFDLDARRQGKLEPISKLEGFKNIATYGEQEGMQEYIDNGKLEIGDTLYLGIDPKCVDNQGNPVILYFKKVGDKYQPVGVFQVTRFNSSVAQPLKDKLIKEFRDRGSKEYISDIKTTVNSLKTGYMQYGEKRDADDILFENIEFFLQNPNGSIMSGTKVLERVKTVKDAKSKAYTLFAAIPILGGKIKIPVQINIKHFNNTEYSKDKYGDTSYYKKIEEICDRLSKATSGDTVMAAMNELRQILYLGDYNMFYDKNSGKILVKKIERDNSGNIIYVNINGSPQEKTSIESSFDINNQTNSAQLIMDWLLKKNFRFQVSIKELNGGNYNKTLLDNGVLVTNLSSLDAKGSWFTVNPLNDKFEEIKGNPVQFPERPPVTNTNVLNDSYKITFRGHSGYTIGKDASGNIQIYSPSGTLIARNSSDGVNAFEYLYEYTIKYGNSSNGSGLIDGIFITSDGIYFNASKCRYATKQEIDNYNSKINANNAPINPPVTTQQEVDEEELPKENYAERDDTNTMVFAGPIRNYFDSKDNKWYRGKTFTRTLDSGKKITFVLRNVFTHNLGSKTEIFAGLELGIILPNGRSKFFGDGSVILRTPDELNSYMNDVIDKLNNPITASSQRLRDTLNNLQSMDKPEIKGLKPEEPVNPPANPSADTESSLMDDIFNEDNDGSAFMLREATSEEEVEDVKAAEEWLKSVLPHIPVSIRNGLLRINDIKAWGMVSNAGITLSNIMAKGTEYHEAFHIVSRYALTEEERSTLYKEASYYTESSDETINEEWLAERFREFMIDRNSLMKRVGLSIRNFFRRISNFLRGIKEVEPYRNVIYKNIMNKHYLDTYISNNEDSISFKSNKKEKTISDEDLRNSGHSDLWIENANEQDREIAKFCIGV